jgi:cation diffusion facilitator family transporter
VRSDVQSEKPITVYVALAANVAIAVTKFIVAGLSGSSAMLSEAIHSVIDSGNELLLLLGVWRGRRAADRRHPYGHGKELYFWALIVAVLLFAVGGGMSIYEGVDRLLHPRPLRAMGWSLAVLGIAFVFEGVSFLIAWRKLRAKNGPRGTLFEAFVWSKDPAVYTVVVEDFAALVGLAVAFVAAIVGHVAHTTYADAIASIVIGVILATVAVFLGRENRGLLLGESASPQVVAELRALAERDEAVRRVECPLTMHLGPDDLLVNLVVQFHANLSSRDIVLAIDRIKARIRGAHPEVHHVFVEPEAGAS